MLEDAHPHHVQVDVAQAVEGVHSVLHQGAMARVERVLPPQAVEFGGSEVNVSENPLERADLQDAIPTNWN